MVSGTGQQPELRLFRPDDLDAVQELIFRTIDVCYTGVYPSQAVAFFKEYHSKDNILEDSEQGHTFVLEVDGRIVGVGCLVKATIKRVFVDPEFQHRGYGRMMMARLEEQARESGVAVVDLDASLPSKGLYDFLGYQGDELARIPVGSGRFLDFYPMTRTLG
jgi:GNAT superfamily N-acetyltransferase